MWQEGISKYFLQGQASSGQESEIGLQTAFCVRIVHSMDRREGWAPIQTSCWLSWSKTWKFSISGLGWSNSRNNTDTPETGEMQAALFIRETSCKPRRHYRPLQLVWRHGKDDLRKVTLLLSISGQVHTDLWVAAPSLYWTDEPYEILYWHDNRWRDVCIAWNTLALSPEEYDHVFYRWIQLTHNRILYNIFCIVRDKWSSARLCL